MNRSRLDQLEAKREELVNAILAEIDKGNAANLLNVKALTEQIERNGKMIFSEITGYAMEQTGE